MKARVNRPGIAGGSIPCEVGVMARNRQVIHHLGPWKGLEDVEYATLEWVAWYNAQRLMEPLGDVPPAEYEERYHRAQADFSAAALN